MGEIVLILGKALRGMFQAALFREIFLHFSEDTLRFADDRNLIKGVF